MLCLNVDCRKEFDQRKGTRGKFCIQCVRRKEPYKFRCLYCGNVFEKYTLNSAIPKYCKPTCMRKYKYRLYKKPSTHNSLCDLVLELLKRGEHTKESISKITGCELSSVRQIIFTLRKKHVIKLKHVYYTNTVDEE